MKVNNPIALVSRTAQDVGGGGGVEMRSRATPARTAESADLRDVAATLLAMDAVDPDAVIEDMRALSRARAALRAASKRGAAERAEMADAQAVLVDALDTMHAAGAAVQEKADDAGIDLSHGVAKQRRMLRYGEAFDAMLELLNEAGDVLFLMFKLPQYAVLFWWSLAALVGSLLMRLAIGLTSWHRVDWPSKGRWYVAGLLTMLVEPMTGGRMVRRALISHEEAAGERSWDGATRSWVTAERQRDDRAVRARNDLAAATAELRNSMVLVFVEDVQELVIELLYLAWSDGLDVHKLAADPLLLITTAGTLAHMGRQLVEARALWRELPELRRVAECRDMAFAAGATDDDLARFARRARGAARRVDLRTCIASITDKGIAALARCCPQLRSVDVSGTTGRPNETLTDAGATALAQGCPQLSSVNFECCDKLTDAGATALAQGCPQLSSVNFMGCGMTDAGAKALAQGCPQLSSVSFEGCRKLTDAGAKALAQGCPKLSSVDFRGCGKLTDAALGLFRERGVDVRFEPEAVLEVREL